MPPQDAELEALLRLPREGLDIEIKDWLDLKSNEHRASLAKEIIALANHGGGFLIAGFSEDTAGQFSPGHDRPKDLSDWSQDSVQAIVSRYVEPSLQCRVVHTRHPDTLLHHPIVIVPGRHRVPIRARSGSPDNKKLMAGRVYVRRPGPASEEPQTPSEWDELLERCLRNRQTELLAGIRDLLAGAIPSVAEATPEKDDLGEFIETGRERWRNLTKRLPSDAPARFPLGHYEAGIAIQGEFNRLAAMDFRNLLSRSLRNHSGWPPFAFIDRPPHPPSLVEGAVESWLGVNSDGSFPPPSHADFWRISPDGRFYTKRGFMEDDKRKGLMPGTSFNLTTPIWRVGEIILQAAYVANALEAKGANLVAKFVWTGLDGRVLVNMDGPGLSLPRSAHQDTFQTSQTASLAAIPDALPEIVLALLEPLYQLFEFFNLPRRVVEVELRKLLAQSF